MEGYNGRLDSIQAGILQVKLSHLDRWNSLRRERAADYNRLLENDDSVIRPHEPSWSRGVYHLYIVRSGNRDGLINFLKSKGIGTGIHYPVPLHLQKPYSFMNYTREDLPVASRVASEIVSLPMFPQLKVEQQARVAEEVQAFTRGTSGENLGDSKEVVQAAEQPA
jgi:dTDP-4-amino-4,6-dideoxygalactose transaminase